MACSPSARILAWETFTRLHGGLDEDHRRDHRFPLPGPAFQTAEASSTFLRCLLGVHGGPLTLDVSPTEHHLREIDVMMGLRLRPGATRIIGICLLPAHARHQRSKPYASCVRSRQMRRYLR